ncbi:MAG TPA: hypothetical protein VFW64_15655 [Pseudonocardiaceae bacterium]|nr:hypothetical protein [Pseudonocardiaceae bacterium]
MTRIWVAELRINRRTAQKIAQVHGITEDELRDAVECVRGLYRSTLLARSSWVYRSIPDSAPNCACAAVVTLVDATNSAPIPVAVPSPSVTTQSLRGSRCVNLGSLSTDLGAPPKSANRQRNTS